MAYLTHLESPPFDAHLRPLRHVLEFLGFEDPDVDRMVVLAGLVAARKAKLEFPLMANGFAVKDLSNEAPVKQIIAEVGPDRNPIRVIEMVRGSGRGDEEAARL